MELICPRGLHTICVGILTLPLPAFLAINPPTSCHLVRKSEWASGRESSGSSSSSGRPKGEERGAVFGEERGVKMSWQAYVDDHLMCEIDDMQLTAAAILGLDGSVWAQSATFPQVWVLLHRRLTYSCVVDGSDPRSLGSCTPHLCVVAWDRLFLSSSLLVRFERSDGSQKEIKKMELCLS